MATITPPKKSSKIANSDNDNDNPNIENKKAIALSKPSPTETVNLNLTVPNSLKMEYKVFCALQGKNMNTVFEEMFHEYKTKF